VVQTLREFIKIDTSQRNETDGALFLQRILDREGIVSEILTQEPRRGNLVARLRGSGRKKPLLLMGHIDVVGVERDKWSVDPFAAVIQDGYLYGRGAADDKGHLCAFLEIFLQLHRLKVPLDRDVIFIAEAGEEDKPGIGIEFLVHEHWDKIACEFALNEGALIFQQDDRVEYVSVATAEKVPRRIELVARGPGGHGSRPTLDNPALRLATAVYKLGTWQAPLRLNETTRAYFARLAEISSPEDASLYRHLEDPQHGPRVQEQIRATQPLHNAMLRTTITPTVLQAGNESRVNVVPSEVRAKLDMRVLPDEDLGALSGTLHQLVADSGVELTIVPGTRQPTTPSRLDTGMFRALERAQARVFPGAITIPTMSAGATDSAQLRAKGVHAYGIGATRSHEDGARMHGNDERVHLATLRKFLQWVWWAVIEVAATPSAPSGN
jgi:acetylornithine deacetylase/succinyl-diaminopimelate desuccinylase-like protein